MGKILREFKDFLMQGNLITPVELTVKIRDAPDSVVAHLARRSRLYNVVPIITNLAHAEPGRGHARATFLITAAREHRLPRRLLA